MTLIMGLIVDRSHQEVLTDIFKDYDVDNNGYISKDEFSAILTKY